MNDKRYTIKRHIKELISTTAKEYQCVVLTGPRQIGKSTLLINLFPKYNYVQLDNQKIINEAKLDPELFMQKYKSPLIIDEIQKAPILFSYIKEKIDQDEKAKFIVTGSESFELMKGIGESLSTRAAIINMSSLSIAEINKEPIFTYKPDINLFLTRRAKTKTQYEIFGDIIKGSMPDIINGNKTNIQLFYKSYIETSIIKDMKEDWVSIKDGGKFMDFLKILASQTGQIFTTHSIAKLSSMDDKTCAIWLNGLKAMGIIFFTHPFSKNIIKRIIKNPKLYFYDTGLVAYLLGFTDTKSLLNSSFAGHIFECYVISNIYKGFINAGQNPSLFYIKEQRLVEADKQKEIDLILEGEGGKVYPIEIKMRVLANIHDFDNVSLLNKEKNEIASMTVVCCATSVTTLGKDKLVLPVTCL